jgi:hypothetical protein
MRDSSVVKFQDCLAHPIASALGYEVHPYVIVYSTCQNTIRSVTFKALKKLTHMEIPVMLDVA